MFDFFGKKSKASTDSGPKPDAQAEDTTRRDVAIGELRDGLIKVLQTERGVHAETLMAVIGAIAGCAAATVVHEKAAAGQASLVTLQLADKSSAFMGDDLNAYLAPQDPNIVSLWALAAGGVLQTGLAQEQLPDVRPLFGDAAGSIGGEDYFGYDRYGDNQPGVNLREAMEGFGFARKVFTRDTPAAPGKVVPKSQWPYVAGAVAQAYIVMTKDILDPTIAFRLVMDSAIRASKLDPRTFP
jgi:hypothetical protein